PLGTIPDGERPATCPNYVRDVMDGRPPHLAIPPPAAGATRGTPAHDSHPPAPGEVEEPVEVEGVARPGVQGRRLQKPGAEGLVDHAVVSGDRRRQGRPGNSPHGRGCEGGCCPQIVTLTGAFQAHEPGHPWIA